MTQNTATQMNEIEIKRYLFGEMSDEERDAMEEDFFENDELFFEIADTENNLVDLFAHGKLTGEELTRFERSLEKFPERRAKIANAVALQTFIAEERPQEVAETAVAGQTIWQKIADFFTIKTPAFGYSMATVMLLFAFATVFLLIDNRRKSDEITRLGNNQQTVWDERQKQLESDLKTIEADYNNLKTQSEKAGDLAESDLDRLNEEIERKKKELDQLQKERNIVPTPTPTQSTKPLFATFLLLPSINTRGGSGLSSRSLSIEGEIKTVSMSLILPDTFDKEDRVSITLNGETLASNLPAQKKLKIKISADDIINGRNEIQVIAGDKKVIYVFNMQKK